MYLPCDTCHVTFSMKLKKKEKRSKESKRERFKGHYDQYNGCPHNKNTFLIRAGSLKTLLPDGLSEAVLKADDHQIGCSHCSQQPNNYYINYSLLKKQKTKSRLFWIS